MSGWKPVLASDPEKPNVVFFLVDDLGWSDLGYMGSLFYESPNIDALAESGMLFTQAYAACPVCSPTRAAIMTGKYPARVGITDWIPGLGASNGPEQRVIAPEDLHNLPLEEVSFAEAFKDAGYATFFAGKWHLGETREYWPEQYGFDINVGGYSAGSPKGGYYAPYKNPCLADGPEGEYLSDRLANETIEFIESNRNKPFCAVLSFYNVHTPIQPNMDLVDHFTKKASRLPPVAEPAEGLLGPQKYYRDDNVNLASMIKAVDLNVGRVLDKLKKLGLSKNTIIVFTSDNGGLARVTCNWPLRAGKGWCYEAGIRVPMIIRAPGITTAGTTSNALSTSTDFYPTLLELAGLELRPEQHMDGVSLVPALRGGALERNTLYWHYPHFHGSSWTPGAAVRCGKWKLLELYEEGRVELYNLETDPSEQFNLTETEVQKTEEMLNQLHEWQKSVGAKMPIPNPAYVNK